MFLEDILEVIIILACKDVLTLLDDINRFDSN